MIASGCLRLSAVEVMSAATALCPRRVTLKTVTDGSGASLGACRGRVASGLDTGGVTDGDEAICRLKIGVLVLLRKVSNQMAITVKPAALKQPTLLILDFLCY
jgi:hypothetical protein